MNSFGAALLVNAGAGAGASFDWNGGRLAFSAVATFGGGSVALEYLGPDGTTWLAAPKDTDGTAVSLAAAGIIISELPPGKIRANATTATAVYARADRIPY
jgi:hypothetical protein